MLPDPSEPPPKAAAEPPPEQGVIINGEFVEARMMSAELVAERTEQELAVLKGAEDDAAKRRAMEALLQTVAIYGRPAFDTLAAAGITPAPLQSELDGD